MTKLPNFITKSGQWKPALLILLLISTTQLKLLAATMIFDSGFESGTSAGLKAHTTEGGSFTVVTSPVAMGKYSGRFDLIHDLTKDTYRAEAQLYDGRGNFEFEKEYWFGFNYRYEDWVVDSDSEIAPFQIHNRYETWGSCQLGAAASTAPFVMLSNNDKVYFRIYGNKVLFSETIRKKEWLNIVVHFKISYKGTGFVEVYRNGVKKGRFDGVTSAKSDKCGRLLLSPSFNIGIYKWNWKYGRGPTDSLRRTLVTDNLKIAAGTNGYSMVNPPIFGGATPRPINVTLSGMVSDDFNASTLNSNVWKFYDPIGNSKITMTGSQVAVSVPAGTKHDLWTNTLVAPRIRQASRNTDFTAEVKFDSEVFDKLELQGLTVEQDNNNLLRFDIYSDGSQTNIFSATFINGIPTKRLQAVISNGKPTYLRIKRIGNQFTLSYSYDGSSFTTAVSYSHIMTVGAVGIFTGNAGVIPPAYTGLVDYFKVD
jgi:regulation of enolase protein 1 (concanavalin A-like superfamily)